MDIFGSKRIEGESYENYKIRLKEEKTFFSNLSAELIQSDSGIYVNDLSGMNLQLINEVLGKDETNVNTFLQDIQNSCAIELINDFTVLQRERLNSKALLSNFNVGTKLADIRNKETKRSRFVGFQIKPHESNSVKVSLSQIGVQFDTAETINIYFYSSTSLAPVKIQSITNTKLSSVEWFTLTDFVAEYISETQGSGAEYYIGYYEDDLTGQAIETSLACGTCGNAPKRTIRCRKCRYDNFYLWTTFKSKRPM